MGRCSLLRGFLISTFGIFRCACLSTPQPTFLKARPKRVWFTLTEEPSCPDPPTSISLISPSSQSTLASRSSMWTTGSYCSFAAPTIILTLVQVGPRVKVPPAGNRLLLSVEPLVLQHRLLWPRPTTSCSCWREWGRVGHSWMPPLTTIWIMCITMWMPSLNDENRYVCMSALLHLAMRGQTGLVRIRKHNSAISQKSLGSTSLMFLSY